MQTFPELALVYRLSRGGGDSDNSNDIHRSAVVTMMAVVMVVLDFCRLIAVAICCL